MHLIRTLLVVAASASAFAQTSTTTSRTRSFPPAGLAPTETLQINLLNSAAVSSTGTAALCTGSVSFINATGGTIGTAQSFTVASNQIVSIRLPFASSGSTTRAEIVAAVTFTPSTAPCALSTTLEVYDTSTGVAHVHLSGPEDGHGGFGR